MWYVIAAVVVVAIIVILPLLQWLRESNRRINSLLNGEFDPSLSPLDRMFEAWFKNRPTRDEQRKLFVQFALERGAPRAVVAAELNNSITQAWQGSPEIDAMIRSSLGTPSQPAQRQGDGHQFGAILVQKIEKLQAEFQWSNLGKCIEIKARLRSLDE